MRIIHYFNQRVKKLTILDVKLSQIAAMCMVLIAVKIIPDILKINILWFVILLIVISIRPLYAFYIKE